jgi:hypothetical protein
MTMDMMLDEEINTEEYDLVDDVPPGQYKCMIGKVERVPNKDQHTGSHLFMEFEVCEGEFEGRKIFLRVNLWHSSVKAKQFAYKQVKGLCLSIWGQDQRISDASVFIDAFCAVNVALGKEYEGVKRPEIKSFIELSKWNNPSFVPQVAAQAQAEDDTPF